jgi:hypothetical protein
MFHALLIAAIFVPYMALMVGLGAYIADQVRQDDDPPDTGRGRDRDRAEMSLAA